MTWFHITYNIYLKFINCLVTKIGMIFKDLNWWGIGRMSIYDVLVNQQFTNMVQAIVGTCKGEEVH